MDNWLWIGAVALIIIVVMLIVRQRTSQGVVDLTPKVQQFQPNQSTNPPVQSSELLDRVRNALARKNKIEAIKLVREQTGLGLKEAKDYVDALERGQSVPPLPTQSMPKPKLDQHELHRQVHGLLQANQKIDAIKLVREQTGLGLKEAKDYVDALEKTPGE